MTQWMQWPWAAMFAFGVLLAIAVPVDMFLMRKRAHAVAWCDGVDWGEGDDEGLATPCQEPLSERTVHRVARVENHAEDGLTGATASLGTFCQAHCPGDCTNPHCRLTVAR